MTNFLIDYKSIEDDIILIDSRSMSDPPLSDIDFENEKAWVWSPDSGLRLKIWSRNMSQNLDIYIKQYKKFIHRIDFGSW